MNSAKIYKFGSEFGLFELKLEKNFKNFGFLFFLFLFMRTNLVSDFLMSKIIQKFKFAEKIKQNERINL